MTRLEPAGEPSMEDILASIRKIIAEDPPGSRALPDVRAEPASPSVTDRIFQRMGEPARSEPAKPAVATEPYLRSTMPSLSSTPIISPATGTQKPFDIDAQMAEVLSKTRGMAQRRDVEPSFGPVGPDVQGAEVQAALDSLAVAPNLGAPPAPEPRAGFTVARDGFVPQTPAKVPFNAPLNDRVSDPFEFSLGPSPFAVRSAQAPAIETAMPEVRDTRYQDFGTIVPVRTIIHDAARDETQVAANVAGKANDGPNPIEAGAAEVTVTPAAESAEAKPNDATLNGVPSPEAIAAQLKDVEAAINAPAAEPVAVPESVETVLAELKLKLDVSAAHEMEAGSKASGPHTEPEPETAPVPVAAETADAELAAATAVDAVPEKVAETEVEAEPAAAQATASDARSADFVDIMEPAPTVAPVMDRQFVRETAQEMVIADQGRSAPNADSPSPFDNMQVSAMQNGGIPGSRSMEDTVAELLRPMLRSWLAENMPKIVERALRKEIDDSIHSEHKTAAE